MTHEIDGENQRIKKERAEPKFYYKRPATLTDGPYRGEEVLTFYSHVYGNNPLVRISPDIDIFSDFEITENIRARYIRLKGKITGDRFPSREAYITDSRDQSVFIGVSKYKGDPWDLRYPNEGDNAIDFDFKIKTDYSGNFVEVVENGYTYSIYSWNSKFINESIH